MSSELSFALLIGKLKQLRRRGWIRDNVPNPESDGDHMYRMAILSFFADDESLDVSRVIQLSLAHDMCEAISGDVTPFDGVSREDKFKAESSAMQTIAEMVPGVGDKFQKLWLEYESQSTAEAIFVHDLDKFDMYLQAFEYEQLHNIKLDRFFEKRHIFHTEKVQRWYDEVVSLRNSKISS